MHDPTIPERTDNNRNHSPTLTSAHDHAHLAQQPLTLRHLNFASAAWVARMVRGNASPWHPLDLPWDEAPGWDGIPWDRKARPSLDEVLTVRRQRQAMVRHVLESLTDEQLAADVTRIEPGWPQMENFPVKECLRILALSLDPPTDWVLSGVSE